MASKIVQNKTGNSTDSVQELNFPVQEKPVSVRNGPNCTEKPIPPSTKGKKDTKKAEKLYRDILSKKVADLRADTLARHASISKTDVKDVLVRAKKQGAVHKPGKSWTYTKKWQSI